jgi:uncharacterized protein
MIEAKKANRLINATSPYLQQHAYNPVDWFEWGDEALSKAVRENKPILVSIGYSSCHWCHVMEREVFENDEIAGIMNELMVCIKVDREERPDIDSIYMEAVQAMGAHGGWPLNVFLTPDQKPFYGGTYFPPDQWLNVIRGVHKGFAERRPEVDASANELAQLLASQDTSHFKKVYEFKELKTDLGEMFGKISGSFDKNWGGLDKAPKFIMPSVWLWMLRYYKITKNEEALHHLKITLQRIAWGGIYDQVGGGFARYSVDAYWFVPHFEKMLYDNAQLLSLYAEAYAVTRDELFRNVVIETFEWLQTEMTGPDGGFYSALDADSEGEEGKFYVWKRKEIGEILKDDATLFCDFYNVKPEGNWEHGNSILIRTQTDSAFLQKHNLSRGEWAGTLRSMKDKVLAVRDGRVRPGLDDKIITSWNAMMVCGLLDAYKYVGDERFLRAASVNMKFIGKELLDGSVIYRSFKTRRSGVRGFLDDYAYVIQASIRLYEVTFEESWIRLAEKLTASVIENFHDKEDGFFFYTGTESEKLIARRKELFDNVIPSSNSVMVQNLFRLGTILGKEEWTRLAESITTPLAHLIVKEPNYMSNWGIAYTEMKNGFAEVVIAGNEPHKMVAALFETYQPFAVTMGAQAESQLPLVRDKTSVGGKDTIYVCFNKTCQRPVHEIREAIEQIEHAPAST